MFAMNTTRSSSSYWQRRRLTTRKTLIFSRYVILMFLMQLTHYITRCTQNGLGYESLGIALQGLVLDPQTVDETMASLLALALSDFSLPGLFTSIRGAQGDDLEVRLAEFQSRLGTIHRPEDLAFCNTTSIRYGMYKLFEELFYLSHRNQGVLSEQGLLKSVNTRFIETRSDESVSEKEHLVLQKVLRRLLDTSATTSEARRIFQ